MAACRAVTVTPEEMCVDSDLKSHVSTNCVYFSCFYKPLFTPCGFSPQGPIGVPGVMGEPGLFGAKVTNIMAPQLRLLYREHYQSQWELH